MRNNRFFILMILLSFFLSHSTVMAQRKRIHEDKRKNFDKKGGAGSHSKATKKKTDPQKKAAQKEKAIKNIVPYKKSITAGRRISEKESREKLLHSENRTRLLRLLKEKIDGKKMKTKKTHFSKPDLKLLRKLDAFKKKLKEEDDDLKVLEEQIPQKDNEIRKTVQDIKEERIKITKLLEEKKSSDELKVQRLVKILEGVKPNQLAQFLENIDQDLFIVIIGKMKPKVFAKALKYISKDKAIKLNEKFLAQDK